MVELAALEMLCALSGTVGSNPTLSAISFALFSRALFVASGSAQGLFCEPRQAGNGATVANSSCVAVKSEAALGLKSVDGGRCSVSSMFGVCSRFNVRCSAFVQGTTYDVQSLFSQLGLFLSSVFVFSFSFFFLLVSFGRLPFLKFLLFHFYFFDSLSSFFVFRF